MLQIRNLQVFIFRRQCINVGDIFINRIGFKKKPIVWNAFKNRFKFGISQ